MITMGKTPFADLQRSWALVVIGIGTAIFGIATSFIPGYFTKFVRILVGIVLFAGGITLFMQLCMSERKAKMWIKIPGILRQLTIACALVYALTIILGLITLAPGLGADLRTAILVMFYGMSFFYLSWCIRKIAGTYGPENPRHKWTPPLHIGFPHSEGNKNATEWRTTGHLAPGLGRAIYGPLVRSRMLQRSSVSDGN